MVSAFDVELPFPVRNIRRRRLSINEVSTYRDIALTRGHAGRGLGKAKNALGAVEAARLVDVMRQVDVSAAGLLGRHDFLLALDRAGVKLPAEDKDALFRSLSSARAGVGCDIEMFAYLVHFWAGNEGVTTPMAMVAGRREREQASDLMFPGRSLQEQHEPSAAVVSLAGRRHQEVAPESPDGARDHHDSAAAGLREYAGGKEGGHASSDRRKCVDNTPSIGFETASIRANPLQQQHERQQLQPQQVDAVAAGGGGGGDSGGSGRRSGPDAIAGVESRDAVTAAAAAAAGRKNSFSVNMSDIMSHVAVKDARAYSGSAGRSTGGIGMTENSAHGRSEHDDRVAVDRSPAAKRISRDADMVRSGDDSFGDEAPDEAYMHSLGYGNLGSVLPILFDRRSALETYLDRLSQSGSGRVRPGDFMAAVRQVGIALSLVQEANMMGLLNRMGAVTVAEDDCHWVDAGSALAAISLAGKKGRGGCSPQKARSPLMEGTRLLEALSERYAEVHVSLLPSSILLGPGALEERRAAPDDGASGVFVTTGSLRNAMRKAGVLIGDADERLLWRLLLRRGQETLGRSGGSGGGGGNVMADGPDSNPMPHGEGAGAATRLLAQGMIPLPLLDAVMGFDAAEALRVRRQLQELEVHPPPAVPPPYRNHLGTWFVTGTPGTVKDPNGEEDVDKAPLLLQKARLRVKGLGSTMAEREQAVAMCLPKLGPKGEQQRLPRVDLTRLLQHLRVGVRSGELQNLWYHMDRNKITRQGFRRILLEETNSLPVTFPASPCPHPGGPFGPTSDLSVAGDSTPNGVVAASEARVQQALNRSAYEDNARHAVAGSAMTRVLRGVEEDESRRDDVAAVGTVGSPSNDNNNDNHQAGSGASGGDNDLPVLLQRALKRVRELDNGAEVVSALVPDMGRVREETRITRGDIQRVLHGLGVTPHSGELQKLWWSLEGGDVGGPRISVEGFRSLLQGRTSKLVLLQDQGALVDAGTLVEERWSHGHSQLERQRAPGTRVGEGFASSSPVSSALREVKTSLGLVRRRVRGIVRGCEDRDLSATGFVTEEAFLAVLKEQGILQQLGNFGLSSLRHAVVVDRGMAGAKGKGTAATAAVRYTGLVGAIDTYLEAVVSCDKSDAALMLGVADDVARASGGTAGEEVDARSTAAAAVGGVGEGSGLGGHGGHTLNIGDGASMPPPQQRPGFRPVKRTMVGERDSPNTVARATRGWDNDCPVVPPGMRHYPQKPCTMAAIVGNGGFGDRAVPLGGGGQAGSKREYSSRSPSSAMKNAFQWGGGSATYSPPPPPLPPPATPSPRHPMSSDHTTPHIGGAEGEVIYDVYDGAAATSPPGERRRTCVDFRPAGGASGLEKPHGSSGRRGSVGKSLGMSGVGVSRSIRPDIEEAALEQSGNNDAGDDLYGGGRGSLGSCGSGGDGRGGQGSARSTSDLGGEGDALPSPAYSRRRQSNTAQLRDIVQAWPEAAPATAGEQGHVSGHAGDNGSENGDGAPRSSRHGGSSPGVLEGGVQRRRSAAKALLSDRALLAGVFRQLSGSGAGGDRQGRDVLDRARLVKLFLYARMPLDLSHEEAEGLADAVLDHCGAPTARFSSLTTCLVKMANRSSGSSSSSSNRRSHADADALANRHGLAPPVGHGEADDVEEEDEGEEEGVFHLLRDDPIAQSIRRSVMEGRSELRLAGGDADSRLACAVHLRNTFRKRRKSVGGDPGGVDDCSVATADLNGVLQDMGVILSPTQAAFVIQKCRAARTPGRRPSAGGMDEASIRAGDVLTFFRELLSVD